jgi:hypothetical protein
MRQKSRMTILAAILTACSQPPPPEQSAVTQSEKETSASLPASDMTEPAPADIAPDASPGSMIVYACDDGSGVTVTYDEYAALVKLPTGSTMLSRADAASGGGIDAYLGEELSLYRNGNIVELQVAGRTRVCNKP